MVDPARELRRLRAVGAAAAIVAALSTLLLVGDWLIAVRRAPAEKLSIEQLEEQTRDDPTVAENLHAERERQTQASLGREARAQVAAWTLLVAGGAFVACGIRYTSLRPQRLPALEQLVAERFAVPTRPVASRVTAPAEPTADEAAFVDGLVARYGRSREAAIPMLQAVQDHFRYLPDTVLRRICEQTDITPAQIAGTSSFYAQFRRSPVGRYLVRVCHGTACHVAGAEQITDELRRHLKIAPGEDTDPQRLVTLDAVACLGCCSLAPVMMIEDDTAGRLTPATARQALDALVSGS